MKLKATFTLLTIGITMFVGIMFSSCEVGLLKEEDAPDNRLKALTTFSHWEISAINGEYIDPESDQYRCYQFHTNGTLDIYKAEKRNNSWFLVIDESVLGSTWTLGHDTLTLIENGEKIKYQFTNYRKKLLILRNMKIRNTIGLIPSEKNVSSNIASTEATSQNSTPSEEEEN